MSEPVQYVDKYPGTTFLRCSMCGEKCGTEAAPVLCPKGHPGHMRYRYILVEPQSTLSADPPLIVQG